MTDEAKFKSKFRASAKWKKFRAWIKKERNSVDEVTGKPLLKGWQLHHKDMRIENYTDLTPENFSCLNKTTHKVIHWLARYDNWKAVLYNLSKILTEMEKLNK